MTSGLQQFEFEIVAIDRQGEIVERSIQRAQQVAEDLGNGVILEMVAIQGGMFRMARGRARLRGRASSAQCAGRRVSDGEIPGHAGTVGSRHGLDATLPLPRRQTAGGPRLLHNSWEFCQRLAQRRDEPIVCPARPSGNTPVGPTPRRRSTSARPLPRTWRTTSASTRTWESRRESTATGRRTEAVFPRTPMGCSTCRQRLGMVRRRLARRLWWRADGRQGWESRRAVDRVLRGGCWHDPPGLCRSAARLSRRQTKGRTSLGSGWRWGHWKQALTSPSSRVECVQ